MGRALALLVRVLDWGGRYVLTASHSSHVWIYRYFDIITCELVGVCVNVFMFMLRVPKLEEVDHVLQ